MMREFQAENDQHQKLTENNFTTSVNATADDVNLSSTLDEQSKLSSSLGSSKQQDLHHNDINRSKNSSNMPESHSTIDKNKLTNKAANRLTSDVAKVR